MKTKVKEQNIIWLCRSKEIRVEHEWGQPRKNNVCMYPGQAEHMDRYRYDLRTGNGRPFVVSRSRGVKSPIPIHKVYKRGGN
jgi:hypothetical protein